MGIPQIVYKSPLLNRSSSPYRMTLVNVAARVHMYNPGNFKVMCYWRFLYTSFIESWNVILNSEKVAEMIVWSVKLTYFFFTWPYIWFSQRSRRKGQQKRILEKPIFSFPRLLPVHNRFYYFCILEWNWKAWRQW